MAPPATPLPDITALRFVMNRSKELTTPEDSSLPCHAHRELHRAESECKRLLEEANSAKKKLVEAEEQYMHHRANSSNNGSLDDTENQQQQQQTKRLYQKMQEARQQNVAMNYFHRVCVINALCPRQMGLYGNCFRVARESLGDQALHEMSRQRVLDRVCKPERELLQRCIGRLVSSSVEDELYPTVTFKDTTTNMNFGQSGGWFGSSMDDQNVDNNSQHVGNGCQ